MEGTDLLLLATRLGDQALAVFQENTHTSAMAQGPLQETGDNGDSSTEDVSPKEVKVSPVCGTKRGQPGTGLGTNGAGQDDNATRRTDVIHRICDLFAKVAVAANARRATVEKKARRASAEKLFVWIDSPETPAHERRVYRDELRARAYGSDEAAHRPQPSKVRAPSFDEGTLELRARLQDLVDSGEIDTVEPFELRTAVHLEDPGRVARSLLRDLERPDSARCRYGAAQRDLREFVRQLTVVQRSRVR